MSIGYIAVYCSEIKDYLKQDKAIIHHCTAFNKILCNQVLLMASYLMLVEGDNLTNVWKTFAAKFDSDLEPYRDSGTRTNTFGLTNFVVLQALHKATQLKWFDVNRFNSKEYFRLNQLDQGDINWIIPGCILAMSSPSSSQKDRALKPSTFINYFLTQRVKTVVRLNEKMYSHEAFESHDISVYDMEYPDGSNPPDEIIVEFI